MMLRIVYFSEIGWFSFGGLVAGEVTEVAEAVFYLASDEASYITAETMRVDGGWVAYQLF